MEKVNILFDELSVALSKARTLVDLRATYASFKRRIDCLNETGNEKARALYWSNKRRIFGRDYDFNVLPYELQGTPPTYMKGN